MYGLSRYVLIPAILVLLLVRKYKERTWRYCTNNIKLDGKVAIITGANSGIGYEVTKELARRGAHVIMACRDLNKAAKAMYKIKQELKTSSMIVPMELDLSSVESIKQFCDNVTSTYTKIHILINNAGVSFPNNIRIQTKEGLEIHFGVNYFGHFLLTNLLLNPLSNAESSRIIVITSMLHEKGELRLKDLNSERVTTKTDSYANSKLAGLYFCRELARRLPGTNIKVVAACPGWVYTNLFRHHSLRWYQLLLALPIAFLFMRTPKQGAQTPLYCATQPNIQSGCLYKDCRKYKSKVDFDVEVSNILWYRTKQIAERIEENLQLGIFFELPFQ